MDISGLGTRDIAGRCIWGRPPRKVKASLVTMEDGVSFSSTNPYWQLVVGGRPADKMTVWPQEVTSTSTVPSLPAPVTQSTESAAT